MVAVVTPRQLSTLLASTIPAGLPVLVTGAPGGGKSEVVDQAAQDAGADVILSHPAVSDPTDAKGMPWTDGKGGATFLPFGELARALKARKRTVWFLDDLGQATAAVQASFMQLLLARRVNGHKLPEHITFIAATNRRVDRAGVTGILEPVKSRFVTIVELQPNIDDWSAWALSHDVPPEMVAFLRFRPELLSRFEPSADMTQCPLPRTWSHAAKVLALGLPSDIESLALQGCVGEGAATELMAFLSMWKQLPSIDAILVNPDQADIPTNPATLYAVVTALAQRVTEKNFARIIQYTSRLADAGHGEFSALLVRDVLRKDPSLANTTTFVRVASGPLGHLLGGQS